MKRTATLSESASLACTSLLFTALLTLLVLGSGVVSASAQIKGHPRHPRSVGDLLTEMQVMLVESKPSTKARRAGVVRNRIKTYEAFTLEVSIDGDENNVRDVIFIEDKPKGKIYEVRGFEFPRPFTDFAWRGNDTLVFDQWMQPHYAVHYEINVRQRKLVVASSFWERGFEP